jgi:hypothetical protein
MTGTSLIAQLAHVPTSAKRSRETTDTAVHAHWVGLAVLHSLSHCAPMPTAAEIARMSPADRIAEAMRRALPLLPSDARSVVEAMLRPESIALITGTLVLWAGSHLFGVGEMVDVVLLGAGVLAFGYATSFTSGRRLRGNHRVRRHRYRTQSIVV